MAFASTLFTACGGSDPPPEVVTFSFRIHGLSASEEFRHATASPQLIAQARAQLALPVAQRRRFASGPIRAGNGGHNLSWNWHYADLALVETAIEVCDGRPSMVEADLPYWLGTVGSFCPWGSYVDAELR